MAKKARPFIQLECTECRSRNYTTSKSRLQKQGQAQVQSLALRKHCPQCSRHTQHIEKKIPKPQR